MNSLFLDDRVTNGCGVAGRFVPRASVLFVSAVLGVVSGMAWSAEASKASAPARAAPATVHPPTLAAASVARRARGVQANLPPCTSLEGKVLRDVLTELNQVNRRQLTLVNARQGSFKLGGMICAKDVEIFAKHLKAWGIATRLSEPGAKR